MSDKPDAQAANTERPEPEDAAVNAAEDGAEEASEESALSNRVLNLETELADTKDRLMRAVAETENVRRRAEREKTDAHSYAVTKFARDLLNVADNLRRAMESAPEGSQDDDSPLKGFMAGVEMTERELLSAFEKHGITKLDPQGEKFDHNFHQAMSEIEMADVENGSIIQVYQPGYVLKDRLLRPAMVVVAKAPKPAKPEAAEAAQDGIDKTV
ncbi:MAG: nucleotide exchange factor GrpE [Pseudomonadota bacterium]